MKGSQETSSEMNQGTLSLGGFAVIDDLAVIEALDQRRVVRRIGLEAAAIGEGAVDVRSLDRDVADAALVDLGQELREGDVL